LSIAPETHPLRLSLSRWQTLSTPAESAATTSFFLLGSEQECQPRRP
jgi:hypothetical protein